MVLRGFSKRNLVVEAEIVHNGVRLPIATVLRQLKALLIESGPKCVSLVLLLPQLEISDLLFHCIHLLAILKSGVLKNRSGSLVDLWLESQLLFLEFPLLLEPLGLQVENFGLLFSEPSGGLSINIVVV